MLERQTVGPSQEVERSGNALQRDTRPHLVKLFEALKSDASAFVLVGTAVGVGIEPALAVPAMAASVLFSGWVLTRRVVLPLRLPKSAKRLDYNHPLPKGRRPRMADGIANLGRDYRTGQQLWLANEDLRQHVAVPGTTGAGKTSALLSLCVNPLSWGSGFIFVDGKADNRLFANVLALARKYGREDDVLALNFLVATGSKHSATFNPFAWGNADVIRELLVSQIESNPTGGDKGGNHIFMQ
ncbi:MAG: conjugal transfer protein TraG, partial [Alphaproteobacteria bacterium]